MQVCCRASTPSRRCRPHVKRLTCSRGRTAGIACTTIMLQGAANSHLSASKTVQAAAKQADFPQYHITSFPGVRSACGKSANQMERCIEVMSTNLVACSCCFLPLCFSFSNLVLERDVFPPSKKFMHINGAWKLRWSKDSN